MGNQIITHPERVESNPEVESVRDYIAAQKEHQRKVSFQDEFRPLLRRYEIEFDERYVWD